jgi:tRNA (guanine37-N1)-methyltransferase
MRIDIVTIFPELFGSFIATSLIGRARERGILDIRLHNLRGFTHDRHRQVDDEPYGGGPGMVMKPEPWFEAVESLPPGHVVLLSPQGRLLTQSIARELAAGEHLVFLCGRYEGVDERVAEHLADEEISIGDYVVGGGETPAMVVIETVARLVPGVVGEPESVADDSFSHGILDHPHYTRPAEFRGLRVPDVLLSGDHAAIFRWRREQAEKRTRERRPDLLP